MGGILLFMLIFIGATAAILLSVLAWRLKNSSLFYVAIGATGIMLIYELYNIKWIISLFKHDFMFGMLHLMFLAIPIFFLIKYATDNANSGFDGAKTGAPVSQEYLDEIINAPDEDIDFEDGLDLK
ncbi:MAG: hypothetical protein ABJG68_14160 [Crocinitomicaceae bacterium]